MQSLTKKGEAFRKKKDGLERFGGGGVGDELLTDSSSESRASGSSTSSSVTATSMEEVKPRRLSSPPLLGWPIRNAEVSRHSISENGNKDDSEFSKVGSKDSEMEMMKERFAKLLLGEDMSGSGKGVCTAMTVSNAITNLCGTLFPFVFGEGEYGATDILYAAARSKSCEVFRLLLDFAMSLRFMGDGGEVEEHIGEEGSSLCVFKWEMMNRAAHAAARGGNLQILKQLLAGSSSSHVLAYRDAHGSTVLHAAVSKGHVQGYAAVSKGHVQWWAWV